jgi:hypothetical protein
MKVVLWLCALYVIITGEVFAGQHEQTLPEYGAQCAREIGEIPPFDCNSGTNIPITINGKRPGQNESPNRCDRPSLLHPDQDTGGQCIPYSKILNLSRGDSQISVYCRRETLRADQSPFYDEVDIVLHHAGNGKTCWFTSRPPPQHNVDDPKPSCSSPAGCKAVGLDASRVPPPNEKTPPPGHVSAVEFWQTPASTAQHACMSCHDAGPYIYSPYIGQVWNQVPTDPWGKYSSIGPAFARRPLMVINPPGNTCVGCHRIGSEKSCDFYLPFSAGRLSAKGKSAPGNNELANSYPLNHWMPTDNNMSHAQWDAANKRSVDAILLCCQNKSRKDPNCNLTPIATGDKNTEHRVP